VPARKDISSILIIGSGPIVIGQACEFDYSGTQAVKALKEEGYRVILVNSNPATIMTDPEMADATYIEPITADFVARIIEKERPDALLPTLGGQTALNTTLELVDRGVLEEFGVELIGASARAIEAAEDRDKFKQVVERCGLKNARSFIVQTMEQAEEAIESLGFPVIIRPSRTLGGSGGGVIHSQEEVREKIAFGFKCSPIHELLLEESLVGWKELELEVMRDNAGNGVIICGIENLDPMGVHTGDSITVAPIQTLTDKEYQYLRDGALRLMNEIGVDTGGSNCQFAVCPDTGRGVVIEVNPRVSRSSALASKATGFPIAKIAAKLAVGYTLDEIPNDITQKTPSCFEPSIDYVVVKIPRFDFEKFPGGDKRLGTQMKSVGEVMAIGRNFPEAMQKACRSLEVGRTGLLGGPEEQVRELDAVKELLKQQTPIRVYYAALALALGASVDEVHELTDYDPWFLNEFMRIVGIERELREAKAIDETLMLQAKRLGMSDARIAEIVGASEEEVRALRHSQGIRPAFKMVDTCAAEFESNTPYLYSTYETQADAAPSSNRKVVILGGGPNRIGQGVEFDYCCVHASMALADAGIESIMINCNPETVSTDYDTSDRLYFEPLTLEDVLEIVERERPDGVIVQYGGQTPLKLSGGLEEAGVPIIGTPPAAIDESEDRDKFRELLIKLDLKQSEGGTASTAEQAHEVAKRIGFPLLVRPSFVLGGRAMAIIHSHQELDSYITESVQVSFARPVLLDRFLDRAIEVDVDAVSDGKEVIVCGIMEHVERAGVHSGDSSFMLPAQTLEADTIAELEAAAKALAMETGVLGLMNVQFAVTPDKTVYVIEVNPRASRSVPFVAKVMGIPWAKVGCRIMAGSTIDELAKSGEYGDLAAARNYTQLSSTLPYVAVKQSVFPFVKFPGVDTVLGPEMRSTGEVMGIDTNVAGSFSRAQFAADRPLPLEGAVFLSLRDEDKEDAIPLVKKLQLLGFTLVATAGTRRFFEEHGVKIELVNKVREGSPHCVDLIQQGKIQFVINTPEGSGPMLDSRSIRSTANALSLPLFTTLAAAEAAVNSIEKGISGKGFKVRSLQEFLSLR